MVYGKKETKIINFWKIKKKHLMSIEQAKSQSKNTVLSERKPGRVHKKQPFQKFNRPSINAIQPNPIIDKKNLNNLLNQTLKKEN